MKRKLKQKITSCLLAAGLLFGTLNVSTAVKGAEPVSAAWQTCTTYDGTNVEKQTYSRWANPITSYLTACSDGRIMRVQYGASIEGVLAEYYDDSYQLLDSKLIPEELPIFGGFYESKTHYFLLTGQTNMEESADVEVYRITKYDKDWNRISSAGLYDCNTTVPFDAGSARMDSAGDYLFIRTCHEMYQSSDGRNHQANVTIQLDMERMQITDSFTAIMNSNYGYVSHSFNQFIKTENNHIIGLDHGDAHPRSIALIQYPTDVTTGSFTPSYGNGCIVTDVLNFPGETGENTTGASIGGFELSDSAYLVAGNSVVQDDNNLQRKTRNIFTAAVDKTSNEVTMHWLTNYEEGDGTTSTPHMVKLNANEYLMLWSRENSVFYTKINGLGEAFGDLYQMPGNLSDCAPIVIQDKIVWYTWSDNKITFYTIHQNDLSRTQTNVIENGHDFERQNNITNGIVILKCKHCSITQETSVITDMRLYWNTTGTGSYSTAFDSNRNLGDTFYYLISNITPSDAQNTEIEVSVSDPAMLNWTKTSPTQGYFTIQKSGTATISFYPKYNPELSKQFTVVVKDETEALNAGHFIFTAPENLVYDGTAKLAQVQAKEGLTGIGMIQTKYYNADGELLSHAPIAAGTYTVKIDVSAGANYGEAVDLTDESWTFTIQQAVMPSEPPETMNVSHAQNTVGQILLPENWRWTDLDKSTALLPNSTITATAEYIGTDGLYEPKQITITVDSHIGGTADCTKKAVCEICSQPYGEIAPQNHSIVKLAAPKALAYAASCNENARYYYSCSSCGIVQNEDGAETFEAPDSALGHSVMIDAAITASCTKTGLTEGRHCTRCQEILTAQQLIPALGHHYINQVCSRCGDKQIQITTPPADNTISTPDTPLENSNTNTPPAIGTVLPNESTGELYTVTSADTVDYSKPKSGSTVVHIPAAVTLGSVTYKVTGIAPNAFSKNSKIKKVTIGKNVTVIGNKAFYKCTSLKAITIPAKVTKIGSQAFSKDSSLKNVKLLTKKLTKKNVGKKAFSGIHAKAKVKVPSKMRTAYKKLLKAKGVKGKNQKII